VPLRLAPPGLLLFPIYIPWTLFVLRLELRRPPYHLPVHTPGRGRVLPSPPPPPSLDLGGGDRNLLSFGGGAGALIDVYSICAVISRLLRRPRWNNSHAETAITKATAAEPTPIPTAWLVLRPGVVPCAWAALGLAGRESLPQAGTKSSLTVWLCLKLPTLQSQTTRPIGSASG
jgi:hypothetical protein